jgi:hypothetical protein
MQTATQNINPDANPLHDSEFTSPYMEALEEAICPEKKDVLKQYHVYHAINKQYRFTETEKQPREYAGFVLAKNMEEAFKLSQNDFSPEWQKYGVRSTSVGDIIQDDYGFYMVCGTGFKLLCLLDEEGRE